MVDVLATVRLPYTTGLPDDVAINTFAFHSDETTWTTTADLTDAIVAFYNATQSNTNEVSGMISEVVSRTTSACSVSLAEIIDAGPTVDIGPVEYIDTFTLGAAGQGSTTVSLPLEVSVVSSFRNVSGTGPVARRRGRIFLGPLDISTLDTGGPYPLVQVGTTAALAEATETLAGSAWGVDNFQLSVWSRANGSLQPVEAGFVNNEFDTQRRRAADATARTSWSNLV